MIRPSSRAPEKWHADFEFRPLPLLRNPHVQTVLGALVPGSNCPVPDQRSVVHLADGDRLVLHNNTPLGWKDGDPLALLVHGLTGSHLSPHIRRLRRLLLARRVRVVRMDMRGAGAGLALARGVYHAGRSDDLRAVLAEIAPMEPRLADLAHRPVAGRSVIAADGRRGCQTACARSETCCRRFSPD